MKFNLIINNSIISDVEDIIDCLIKNKNHVITDNGTLVSIIEKNNNVFLSLRSKTNTRNMLLNNQLRDYYKNKSCLVK